MLEAVLLIGNKTKISIIIATKNIHQCNETRKRRVLTIAKEGTKCLFFIIINKESPRRAI